MPERLGTRVPRPLTEIGVGVAIALIFVGIRAALGPLSGTAGPYAFNYVAVVIAAVLAGWRSGTVAAITSQLLSWMFIVDAPAISRSMLYWGFALACLSQFLILSVIALYQREVAVGEAEREQRLALLDQAIAEIDHRTRNNYQTVLALIQLQAQRAPLPAVRDALQSAAARIHAVSMASEQLVRRSDTLETVRLGDHLRELCDQLRRGLSRDEVDVECEVSDVTARADKALYVSILVNELVINALKHAFNGDGAQGRVRVATAQSNGKFELTVTDNGSGMSQVRQTRSDGGLGTRLVETFVQQLGAVHEVRSGDGGTTHRILVADLC